MNSKIIDLTGKKFGKLTVVDYAGSNKDRLSIWNCLCDCGNTKIANGHRLRNGELTSCGCLKKTSPWRKFSKEESSYRDLWKRHKHNRNSESRKDYGYLDYEVWKCISLKDCFYCGNPPQKKTSRYNVDIFANGIDRIDSNLGYVSSNVVPCCFHCNVAKGEFTTEEFFEHLIKILKFSKKI